MCFFGTMCKSLLFMLTNFSCFCCCLLTFFKNSFRNTIRVSNSLDQDQDRSSVGPDLGPNCLQRLSAPLARKELSSHAAISNARLEV